jgi:hypothetical protein
VDGRLTAAEVAPLEESVAEAPGPVRLELSHLLSFDEVGLRALRRLRAAGVPMHGTPPYLAHRILEDE